MNHLRRARVACWAAVLVVAAAVAPLPAAAKKRPCIAWTDAPFCISWSNGFCTRTTTRRVCTARQGDWDLPPTRPRKPVWVKDDSFHRDWALHLDPEGIARNSHGPQVYEVMPVKIELWRNTVADKGTKLQVVLEYPETWVSQGVFTRCEYLETREGSWAGTCESGLPVPCRGNHKRCVVQQEASISFVGWSKGGFSRLPSQAGQFRSRGPELSPDNLDCDCKFAEPPPVKTVKLFPVRPIPQGLGCQTAFECAELAHEAIRRPPPYDGNAISARYEAGCWGGVDFACNTLGWWNRDRPHESRFLHSRACDLGNSASCRAVGSLYARGEIPDSGRTRDGEVLVARWWYQRGCSAGNQSACEDVRKLEAELASADHALGLRYLRGEIADSGKSRPGEVEEAISLFRRGCDYEHQPSCDELSKAEAVLASARHALGLRYLRGEIADSRKSRPAEVEEAINLFRPGCESGHQPSCDDLSRARTVLVSARHALGNRYARGQVTDSGKGRYSQLEEAITLFRRGCNSRHQPSCTDLRTAEAALARFDAHWDRCVPTKNKARFLQPWVRTVTGTDKRKEKKVEACRAEGYRMIAQAFPPR